MERSIPENNEVKVLGTIETNLQFSHEVYGEGFYSFVLNVKRLSDISDYILITVSERLLSGISMEIGKAVEISGQFRSYNSYNNNERKLVLTVFAKDLTPVPPENAAKNLNYIFLNGFVCKPPAYRTTPFGREITDLLLAVNRQYNKSDYIPCIAWGRNARFASELSVGSNIKIWGRVQSREYQKKISENELINKTAYEISISKMEEAEKESQHSLVN
ncbi:MAG: single-stranded DNA-binding protein [Clostridia bacterium]|nr:single-stranded DNA-binding protein [Clostridia bacterium]